MMLDGLHFQWFLASVLCHAACAYVYLVLRDQRADKIRPCSWDIGFSRMSDLSTEQWVISWRLSVEAGALVADVAAPFQPLDMDFIIYKLDSLAVIQESRSFLSRVPQLSLT
jgi:hypothetical protein